MQTGTGAFYYEGDYANFSTLVVNGEVTLYAMWDKKDSGSNHSNTDV